MATRSIASCATCWSEFTRRAQHQCAWNGGLEVAAAGRVLAAGRLAGFAAGFASAAGPSKSARALGVGLGLVERVQHGRRNAAVLPLPVWLETIRSM